MNQTTFKQLVDIIVEVTGNSPENVKPESLLDDDLGIILDEDFERLIMAVNQAFDIELDVNEVGEVISTVSDLANIIDEELELG